VPVTISCKKACAICNEQRRAGWTKYDDDAWEWGYVKCQWLPRKDYRRHVRDIGVPEQCVYMMEHVVCSEGETNVSS